MREQAGTTLPEQSTEPYAECSILAQYCSKPDIAFWLDLLKPSVATTQVAERRRQRVTRLSLGAAILITVLYTLPMLLILQPTLWLVIAFNIAALFGYGLGLWTTSRGMPNTPRRLLIMTLMVQLGVEQILTANYFWIVAFAPTVALLARVLVPQQSASVRGLLYLYTVTLMVHATYSTGTPLYGPELVPAHWLPTIRLLTAVLALIGVMLLVDTYEKLVLLGEADLERERQRSDALLNNVLPESIANQLRQSHKMIANRHPEVTVLFADIAGFTPWSAGRPPEEVLHLLETLFSQFDQLVSQANAEKIKTIGDAYMVISGAPEENRDHVSVIADLALNMMRTVQQISEDTGLDLSLRAGIHTGPVIAGVIGAMRFSYDVWGDTVNTASRMESHGEPGRIQISQTTRERLDQRFSVEQRGTISVKGKGDMTTWWLLGADRY